MMIKNQYIDVNKLQIFWIILNELLADEDARIFTESISVLNRLRIFKFQYI